MHEMLLGALEGALTTALPLLILLWMRRTELHGDMPEGGRAAAPRRGGQQTGIAAASETCLRVDGSVQGSRAARRERAPFSAAFYKAAWLMLAVRMALPLRLSLPGAPVQLALPVVRAPQAAGAMRYRLVLNMPLAGGSQAAAAPGLDLTLAVRLAGWLWLGGAALFLAAKLSVCLLDAAARRRARVPAAAGVCAAAAAAFGRRVRVYECAAVAGPLLAGILCPAVYLPPELDPAALPYVLAHEARHARGKDILIQFVLLAASAVQWANPLAYCMVRAARQDLELACDEAVLRHKPLAWRRAYGEAVLASLRAQRRASVLGTGFGGTQATLKERFSRMFDMRNRKRGILPLTLLIVTVAACTLLAACSEAQGPAAAAALPEQNAAVSESAAPQSAGGLSVPDVTGLTLEKAAQTLQQAGFSASIAADGDAAQTVVTRQNPAAGTSAAADSVVTLFSETPQQGQSLTVDADVSAGLVWPLQQYDYISKTFGDDGHRGADIAAQEGAQICAAAGGTVVRSVSRGADGGNVCAAVPAEKADAAALADEAQSLGCFVVVQDASGRRWTYAHCQDVTVKAGDTVAAGDGIATVGSTGNSTSAHLHLELQDANGQLADPLALFGTLQPLAG